MGWFIIIAGIILLVAANQNRLKVLHNKACPKCYSENIQDVVTVHPYTLIGKWCHDCKHQWRFNSKKDLHG